MFHCFDCLNGILSFRTLIEQDHQGERAGKAGKVACCDLGLCCTELLAQIDGHSTETNAAHIAWQTDSWRDRHAINWTCLDMLLLVLLLLLLLLPCRDFSISAICLTFVRSLRCVAMSIAFALTIATIVYARCHVASAATCGRHCCQPTNVQCRTFIPDTHGVEL